MAGRRGLLLATSTRRDGSMGLAGEWSTGKARRNRRRFLARLGVSQKRLVGGGQVHGAGVAVVGRMWKSLIPKTDALVTAVPGLYLGIISADCFPIFMYDVHGRAVGIAHAGWRGIVKGVVPKTLKLFRERYRVPVRDVRVTIGPGIRKCHFEVWFRDRHRELKSHMPRFQRFIIRKQGRTFVDLPGAIFAQLRQAGIRRVHILDRGECTYHLLKKYYSYRRDKAPGRPYGFGNMLSVIGIKHEEEAAG